MEQHIYQIKLKKNLLSKTENQKYLGVLIDKNLSWKLHIMTITSKLSKLCGLLYKLRPFVNKQILMQVYYTLIYPNLLYGIACWGSCSKTASQPIQIIQKNIAMYKYDRITANLCIRIIYIVKCTQST